MDLEVWPLAKDFWLFFWGREEMKNHIKTMVHIRSETQIPAFEIRIKANEYKESGLRLGVSNGRNETQVYRRREYTESKKVGSPLRKSRITKQIEPTALDRHVFRLRESHAGDAPAPGFPAGHLRPCSRFIWALYGLKN